MRHNRFCPRLWRDSSYALFVFPHVSGLEDSFCLARRQHAQSGWCGSRRRQAFHNLMRQPAIHDRAEVLRVVARLIGERTSAPRDGLCSRSCSDR